MSVLTSEEYEKILSFYDMGLKKKASAYEIQRSLSELFNYCRTIIWSIDKTEQIHSPHLFNLPDKIAREYMMHYRHVDVLHPQQLSHSPHNDVLRINEVMTWEKYEQTEYYQDFMKRHGFYHEMGAYLYQGGRLKAVLGFIRSKEEPPFSEKDLKLLTFLKKPLTIFINEQTLIEESNDKSLTSREKEIILHVREGLTNKEIAASLQVSDNTVKKHLQHIYRKVNVTNRTSLCHVL